MEISGPAFYNLAEGVDRRWSKRVYGSAVEECSTSCKLHVLPIGKISLTSPIVINVPTRAPLAVETKVLSFLWLPNVNNKSNVCKQISSLYRYKPEHSLKPTLGLIGPKQEFFGLRLALINV